MCGFILKMFTGLLSAGTIEILVNHFPLTPKKI